MTLFDNREFLYRGQPLPGHEWQPVVNAGMDTVPDVWDKLAMRLKTHTELGILEVRIDMLRTAQYTSDMDADTA
jgi:hypothetical protein